jgi:tRNA-splicing ligase RtcB
VGVETLRPVLPEIDVSGVRVFESAATPADPIALAQLQSGVAGTDLAALPVALPDFHLKGDKEMPSSIAVATRETIRLTLTSASLNCGMALVALDAERPGTEAVTRFFSRIRERYPYPPTYRRDLTREEVVRCAADGAEFAAERFGVDSDELDRVEEGGRVDVEPFGGIERVRRELPWSVKQLSRIRFGTIGPSNHFIELQEVEEILDPQAAGLLGLERGQITLQYHGGGGSLPGELGLLFGRRKRYPRPVRVQMAVQKPLYHLARARSLAELKHRRELYFSDGCPPVERGGPEGERLLLANAMAMNYGFAFRLSSYASFRPLLRECLGET